jgi:hypothetical protein
VGKVFEPIQSAEDVAVSVFVTEPGRGQAQGSEVAKHPDAMRLSHGRHD